MKVLLVHNFHRTGSASGDDQVFKHEAAMLERAGVNVIKYVVQTDEFDKKGAIGKAFSGLSMFWSTKTYREIRQICKEKNPDIVHVHTFFPLISPAVFVAAHKSGVKVVQTLHDTRYVCPNASSICSGSICKECIDGKYFRMVRKKCFKNSRTQSAVAALIFSVHRLNRTFYKNIDRYIYLNEAQKELFLAADFDDRKFIKKYNSVAEPCPSKSKRVLPEKYAVYCGRIGQEKGISVLCKAWETLPDIPLVIMGAGPQEEKLTQFIQNHSDLQIHYLGYVPHDECQSIMKNSEFVLLPSICYEGCSMTVIEAFSLSKPVVATDVGFMHEAIADIGMDTVFPMKDAIALRDKVRNLWADPQLCERYGSLARKEYETKYSEQIDIENLMRIYADCVRTTTPNDKKTV